MFAMNNFAFVPALALPNASTRTTYLCGSRVRLLRSSFPPRAAPIRWGTIYACAPSEQSPVTPEQPEVEVPKAEENVAQESTAEATEQPVVDEVADPVAEKESEEPVAEKESEEPVAEEKVEEPAAEVQESETDDEKTDVVAEQATEEKAESVAPESTTGEQKPEDRRSKRMRKRRREVTLPLEKMEIGMELDGVVKSVTSYGAFIGDMGTPTDGLLHVSQLSDGYVENVTDVVQIGSKVKVRVTAIDLEKKIFSLSMKSLPSETEQQSQQPVRNRRKENAAKLAGFKFDPSEFVDGKVTTIADFGAFCQLLNPDLSVNEEVPTDGLVHISELSEKRVSSVSDVVKVGQVVKVRITSIDKKRGRISLSMKEDRPVNESEMMTSSGRSFAAEIAASNDNQPKFKTSFELAFERAGLKTDA